MNNPPAFPQGPAQFASAIKCEPGQGVCIPVDERGFEVPLTQQQGMTLRDYFAAAVISGWMASFGPDKREREVEPEYVAKFSFMVADAMLKVREK